MVFSYCAEESLDRIPFIQLLDRRLAEDQAEILGISEHQGPQHPQRRNVVERTPSTIACADRREHLRFGGRHAHAAEVPRSTRIDLSCLRRQFSKIYPGIRKFDLAPEKLPMRPAVVRSE